MTTNVEMYWLVKNGNQYADGDRSWTKRSEAFLFSTERWAQSHMATFDNSNLRIVKLKITRRWSEV